MMYSSIKRYCYVANRFLKWVIPLILLCLAVGDVLAVDSTQVPLQSYVAPAPASQTFDLEDDNGLQIGPISGTSECGTASDPTTLQQTPTASNPHTLRLGPAGGLFSTVAIQTQGFYYISATFNFIQETPIGSGPVNYWVDDWATTPDLNNTITFVQVFYSGDNAIQMNVNGSTSPTVVPPVTFSGLVFLRKGAIVYAPRIWVASSTPDPSVAFCVGASASNPLAGTQPSTFSITLLRAP